MQTVVNPIPQNPSPNVCVPMSVSFADAIRDATEGKDIAADRCRALIGQMLLGTASDDDIGRLLLAIREKGETVEE